MRPLPNLDLLRSIAVALVLLDHTTGALGHRYIWHWDAAWIGVMGVYFFFVHTSLVLMWSLARQPHVLNFYIRRAFRIYPLAIAAITIALLFHIPVSPAGTDTFAHHSFTHMDIVENLLLVQNVFRKICILGVTWSLPLEVQMYVVLPALFLYAHREKRIWQLLVLWALAVATAAAFTPSVGNSLITVVPDFIPGVIAYLGFEKFRARLPAWSFPLFLAVLFVGYMEYAGVRASWPATLALGLMLPLFRQIAQPAVARAAHLIAKYSYGIYLGHPFGLVLGFHVLAGRSPWIQVAAELSLTAVLAVAGYHLIEEPLIRAGSRLARANDRREAAPLARANPVAPSIQAPSL